MASVGSNPTLSAYYALVYSISRYSFSMRRGAGVADQARLESASRLLVTVGSNPTLSAFLISTIVGRPLKHSNSTSYTPPQSWGFLSCPDTSGRPPTLIIGRSVGRAVGLGAPLFQRSHT